MNEETLEVATTVSFGDVEVTIVGVDNNDHIMKHCRTSGTFYESDLLERTRHLIRPNDFVIDVGAHIGNHAMFWSVVCGAQVLAVEPYVDSFMALSSTIEANSVEPYVFARNYALGAESNLGKIIPGPNANLGTTRVRVDATGDTNIRSLDSIPEIGHRSVRAIKVDVEGMELEVLKGALETIRRDRPIIFCECLTPKSEASVESFLGNEGYFLADVFNYSPTYCFMPRGAGDGVEGDDLTAARASLGHMARELSFLKEEVRSLRKQLSDIKGIAPKPGESND